MKLLESTRTKIKNDENGENVPYLEDTEVILMYCNIVSKGYQQNLRVLYTFFRNKSFGQVLDISPKNVIFLKLLTENFHILTCGLQIKILIL